MDDCGQPATARPEAMPQLLELPPVETRTVLTPEKVILYALGVGATELPFVYEHDLRALPTMVVVLGHAGFMLIDSCIKTDWTHILHGETGFTLHAPLPTEGELTGRNSFGPIFDKGAEKGAVVCQARAIHDAGGRLIATVRNSYFLRRDGGRGGSPGEQPRPRPIPDRPPDHVHSLPTALSQAMIYRLSGDFNPLHIDPEVARAAGFEAPILHGLCTFGVVGRSLLAVLCGNDATRIRSMDARFSAPVYPGETIVTEIWREGDGRAAFRAKVAERDLVVLTNGFVEHL